MTAILSFLGSAVFRWLLEKVFNIVERKQDHGQELERIKVQAEVDAAQHLRNLEMLEVQSRLKLDLVKEEHRGAFDAAEGEAFIESIKSAKPSGIAWLDAWNGAIRPLVSTVCVLVWLWLLQTFVPPYVASLSTVEKMAIAGMLVEFTISLVASVIGWHFGTRSLMPGKK
jgi:hypothetical protein